MLQNDVLVINPIDMGLINQGRIFSDRRHAGIELAKVLKSKYKNINALVLGIPRGGVVVAYEIAKELNAQLSVLITKKLPHPEQEELAIGAAAEDGSVYLTSMAERINKNSLQNILASQQIEIQRRVKRFRKDEPLPDMRNRLVILVDDGIATGSTIVPAIKLCRNRKALKVVVTAPVSGERYVSEINALAGEVIILEQPEMFFSVGQVYEDFHHLSDEEVIELLENFNSISNKT